MAEYSAWTAQLSQLVQDIVVPALLYPAFAVLVRSRESVIVVE